MATRTKTAAVSTYAGWPDVDAALAEAKSLSTKLAKINATAADKIATITTKQADDAAPLDAQLKVIGTNINLFTAKHRDELDGKSRKLTHGTVWIRLTPPALKTLKDWTWEKVRAALQARGLKKFLRPKPDDIEKELLKTCGLGEEFLADLGVYVGQDEEIGYDLTDTDAKSVA